MWHREAPLRSHWCKSLRSHVNVGTFSGRSGLRPVSYQLHRTSFSPSRVLRGPHINASPWESPRCEFGKGPNIPRRIVTLWSVHAGFSFREVLSKDRKGQSTRLQRDSTRPVHALDIAMRRTELLKEWSFRVRSLQIDVKVLSYSTTPRLLLASRGTVYREFMPLFAV